MQPVSRAEVPEAARRWIDVAGSMTAAVAAAMGGTPRVTVVFEGADQPQRWEAEQLGCEAPVFARHILLHVGATLCISARSVTPLGSDVADRLAALGTQPLAELLFKGADSRPTGPGCAIRREDGAYGRAVRWAVGDAGLLLVEELFSPDLLAVEVSSRG